MLPNIFQALEAVACTPTSSDPCKPSAQPCCEASRLVCHPSGNSKRMPGVLTPPRTIKHHWQPPLVPAQQGVWSVGVGRPAQKIPFHRVVVYHSRRRPFPCLLSSSLGLHNLLGHHCCLRVLLFCFCLTTSPRSQLIAVRSTSIVWLYCWRSFEPSHGVRHIVLNVD